VLHETFPNPQGADGLRGKLKEDFYTLLERHKEVLDREKMDWQKELSEQQMTQLQQLHVQGDLAIYEMKTKLKYSCHIWTWLKHSHENKNKLVYSCSR